MDEKEKYRAEIDARLLRSGKNLHEIKSHMEQRRQSLPDIRIEDTLRKHRDARAKVKSLDGSDTHTWKRIKAELDTLVNDIDEDVRQALAYFA